MIGEFRFEDVVTMCGQVELTAEDHSEYDNDVIEEVVGLIKEENGASKEAVASFRKSKCLYVIKFWGPEDEDFDQKYYEVCGGTMQFVVDKAMEILKGTK